MKRLSISLICVVLLVGLSTRVLARSGGPDGDVYVTGYFAIFVNEVEGAPLPKDTYATTRFEIDDGWDFGDRASYSCAWVEFFDNADELFEVHYELVTDYPVPAQINDKFGAESEGTGVADSQCGDGVSDVDVPVLHDNSDHFPHGTALTFYRNAQKIAEIDYRLNDDNMCDKGYWTPGNQPGEAWLWWDEDGPAEHAPGMALDCGGGGGEPVAVVRATARHLSAGIGVCTEDTLNGGECRGLTPQHSTDVSLRLGGRIEASGRVSVPDGTAACSQGRRVVILHRDESGHWMKVGIDRSSKSGRYLLRVHARAGKYRAWVRERSLAGGGICMAATSRKRSIQNVSAVGFRERHQHSERPNSIAGSCPYVDGLVDERAGSSAGQPHHHR